MKAFVMAAAIAGICLFAQLGLAFGADDPSLANQYFGHIEAPCAGTNEQGYSKKCEEFKNLVKDAAKETECNRIDEPCEVGEKILKMLFGTTFRKTLPDFIVYLDDSPNDTSGNLKHLTKHRPLLMWKGENTPHLLGVRSIYVVALSHRKVDVTASVTSDYQYQPNPLIGYSRYLMLPESRNPRKRIPRQLLGSSHGCPSVEMKTKTKQGWGCGSA